MSKDFVTALTHKAHQGMKNIVSNWVNDDNFANTSEAKATALALECLLDGLANNDLKSANEGIERLDVLLRNKFNLKK